jgi:hypothetical protein
MPNRTARRTLRGKLLGLCVAGLLGIVAGVAEATIYKYVDRNGVGHYTDSISSIPAEYRDQVEDITDDLARMDGFRVVPGVGGETPPGAQQGDEGLDAEAPDFDLGGFDLAGGEGAAAGILESLGFGVILLALLAVPLLWVLSALVFKLACRIAGEEPPGLGRACGILLAQGLCSSAVGAAVGGLGMVMGIEESASIVGGLAVSGASTVLSWMAGAGILVSMMGYAFLKSMWIGFLHTTLVIVLIGGPIGLLVAIGIWLA